MTSLGCPGVSWYFWALALLGSGVVLMAMTISYQLAFEAWERWRG